ncbi:MAG TPA: hypothetical protein VFO67_02160 [Gemmatimonadales bacterium]|nr:hypothetical protein [Gemmatimonadales bacterium]
MNRLALIGLVLLALGCKDDVASSASVTLRVVLTSPNSGQDGSAVVMLSGPATPRSVVTVAGLQLWGAPVQSSASTIALTGTLTNGTILTFETDERYANQFSATLREVANIDATVGLRELTGYALAVMQ